MSWQIREADWATDGAILLAIRHAVFVTEQGVPIELEHDEHDSDALHLLATGDDGTPVGTARILEDGHIGRIAVLAPWRGQGIGSALLQRLLQVAADRSQEAVFLHAQCVAEPFYERAGFVATGPIFDDAGIDHRLMTRTIATSDDR
jgi:predicted GNAT family N-acyltransferase